MSSTGLGIGGYGDLTEVNRGAFATVFRAWQPTFEREVAIKVLSGRPDEGVIRRFERECAAIGALSGHPNIVTVYDAGTSADGQPYLVMEYLPAGSLADRLHRDGPFYVADVLDLGIRIAGALESAHRAGILHRDLKPENILVSPLGEPKVADFGVAQLPDRSQTISGGVIGTVVHAAPEVLAGDEPTVACDVYSLASTLFSLLWGGPPFVRTGETGLVGVLQRTASEPPPDLRQRGVPDEFCRVLEQGLAKAPGDRQHGVAQLGRQLQAVQAALGLAITRLPIESSGEPPAGPPPVVRGTLTPRPRRHLPRRTRLVTAAMIGVAAVASLVVPLTRDDPDPLPVLYQDNFDAGQNWYEHDDEGAALAYDAGRYRITVKRPNHVVFSDTSFRGGVYGEPLTALTDVSVRVRAQPRTPGAIMGVFCRYAPGGDYYQAVVRSDGAALLLKWQSSTMTTLAEGKAAGVGPGTYVSLRLDCTGSRTTRIVLYADDSRIAEARDRNPVHQGSVGMVASTELPPADVLFEDFVLLGRRQEG